MTTRNQRKYRIIKPRYRTYTNFEEADKYGLSHKLLHNVYEEYGKYRHLEFLEDMPALDPAVNIDHNTLEETIDTLCEFYKSGNYTEIKKILTYGNRSSEFTVLNKEYRGRDNFFLWSSQIPEPWFLSQIEPFDYDNLRLGVQTTIWKNPTLPEAGVYKDIATSIILDVILDKYDGILSDGQQSDSGKKLWAKLANRVMKDNRYSLWTVYRNKRGVTKFHQQITNLAEIEALYDSRYTNALQIGANFDTRIAIIKNSSIN